MDTQHIHGFLYVSNHDHPYIINRKPALSDDHSQQDADCELVAKPFAARGATAAANARRLVACWNACEGASTEVLERGAKNDWAVLMTELEAECAKMRQSLREIATSYPKTDEGETLASIARNALKE